jgi:hypothetical protein
MNDIFISYRRDDSAGHAGRLFDRLKERLGADRVFMDVTDLVPGQDFEVELERAVARADCVLVVIGPRWLEVKDASGLRRIDALNDFVRREIVAGLMKGATVIPVLVQGATMPRAEELPEELRPLSRRQAFVISDGRWDSDVLEFVRDLSAEGSGAAPTGSREPAAKAAPQRRDYRLSAAAFVALILLACGGWIALRSPERTGPVTNAVPHPPPIEARQRFAVALPALSEVKFRTNRAQVVFTILAIRVEARDAGSQLVTVLVRVLNQGPSDEAFSADQFRLVAGDQVIASTTTLITHVEAVEAKETALAFVVPAGIEAVALDVRMYAETTRIPIALSPRTPLADDASLDEFGVRQSPRVVDTLRELPAPLAAGQMANVGKASYKIVAAVIERETAEKASISITVSCTALRDGGGVNFGSGTVRLWIDGVPRAPLNFVNEAVDSRQSKSAVFFFDLMRMPTTLQVGLLEGKDSARVPLALESLAHRPR